MSSTTIRPNFIHTILSPIISFFAVIMSLIVIGNPANFQAYVAEDITTETTKITVIAENKTFNNVGDPRVRSIEKLENGEWVTVGAYTEFTDDYSIYHPFATFKETVSFLGMGMGKTLPEGEYRVVIKFSLRNRQNSGKGELAYAYFTVIAP